MKQATFTRRGYESAGYTSVKRWKQFLQTFCMECLYMQIFMQNCLFQKTSRRFKQNAEAFKAKRRNVFLKRRGLFSTKWRLWRKRIVMHHPAFFHSAKALSIFLFSIAQLFQTTFQLYLQLFQGTFRNKQKQKFRNRHSKRFRNLSFLFLLLLQLHNACRSLFSIAKLGLLHHIFR